MDTSAYFYVSQIYQKQNQTRKESRSVQCGQAVKQTVCVFRNHLAGATTLYISRIEMKPNDIVLNVIWYTSLQH